jgi:hypothetical protein
MIGLLITLLVLLLIVGVIWYVIRTLVPLPPPIDRLAQVVLVVITVAILIWFLLAVAGMAPAVPLLR